MAILRFNGTFLNKLFTSSATAGGTGSGHGPGTLIYLSAGGTAAAMNSAMPNAIIGGGDVALPDRRFNIYAGEIPTDFSGFTNTSQRVGDLLIAFKTPAYTGTTTGNTISADLPDGTPRVLTGIVNTPTAAVGTGTATWFLMSRNDDLVNGSAVIGTVGPTGSGADLEIPDVEIVTGQSYRSAGFYFSYPLNHTLA